MYTNISVMSSYNVTSWHLNKQQTDPHVAFFFLECICSAWFTVEFLLRLLAAPKMTVFLKTPLNIIDFIATASFYLDLILKEAAKVVGDSDFLEFFSIIRILRLFKLTRHSPGLKILIQTFIASGKELSLLVFVMTLGVVVFATLAYFGERMIKNPYNDFTSIPDGLWWATQTMTTIGYGEIVPKTAIGMIVGSVCALTGSLVLTIPVPIMVSNFTRFYSHADARAKLPKKRRRVLPVEAPRPKNLHGSMHGPGAGMGSNFGSIKDAPPVRRRMNETAAN